MSGNDISFSLSLALQSAASMSGRAEELYDVHNLLGLSLFMTAAPEDADLGRWPVLARDAFLIDAGRSLGMIVREIHPPEAAIGIERAAEFRQHFDASYAPLIRRALEHGQTVLAWQGWDSDAEFLWGIITREDPRGVGFAGTPYAATGMTVDRQRDLAIIRPPVQLYVIEEKIVARVDADSWTGTAARHAVAALDPSLGAHFGTVSGGPAFRRWAQVMTPENTDDNLTLTRALLSGIDCFRKGMSSSDVSDLAVRKAVLRLSDYAHALHGEIQNVHDRLVASARCGPSKDVRLIRAAIERAGDLTDHAFGELGNCLPPTALLR